MWIFAVAAVFAAEAPGKVDFARDIQPLLKEQCVGCHGAAQQMKGLRLDRRRGPLPNRIGANGAVITPGDGANSILYLKLVGKRPGLTMPPTGALDAHQIETVKAWIDQGADWPDALSGESSGAVPDPAASRIETALRNGDRANFKKLVLATPSAVNRKGPRGDTPLMYAALYGDADAVRFLLDHGADPNITNEAGATALMYSIDDVRKASVLIDHKADPNVRSGEGRTALLLAAYRSGSGPVVKLLVDHGADVSDTDASGRTALLFAATSGDVEPLQLLLDRGASGQTVPLSETLTNNCRRCFDLLLKLTPQADLDRALATAVGRVDLPTIALLLDRGANSVRATLENTLLIPDSLPLATARTLIDRGKPFLTGDLVDLARRQGKTDLGDLLMKSVTKQDQHPDPMIPTPKPAASAKSAIERSLPLLQRAGVTFIEKSGCVSCHNNSLTSMTMVAARHAGISFNESTEQSQLKAIAEYLGSNRERALEGLGIPGGPDTVSYIMLGLASGKYPADENTDTWAMYLKSRQLADGHWPRQALRPPLEASDIEFTAISMRATQVYAPVARRAEFARSVLLAKDWLLKAQPKTTDDFVFQLLGLEWAAADSAAIQKVAQQLGSLQQADGGWKQTDFLTSDAYATGQALYALSQTGIAAVNTPAYQRGIHFLLNSQLEDGSWYVRSRAVPIQPYFESDFPHGADQFISAAATNWASMALAAAVR